MALRPVDNETFYREVDEELRRDQMKSYWERFGKLAIAGILLVLAAIGGYIWWLNQKEVKAGERSATLVEAFDDVAAGRKAAAVAKLDGLAKSGADGHRAAALLTRADLAIDGKDL
ncbi:MAG: tetratricopeptide repeat protein, partial [Allosphingosinicella sp.]